jgi:small subunit ribosomal protein S20
VPHSLSAKKRVRQDAKRRLKNRAQRSTQKSQVREFTEKLAAEGPAAVETQYREVCKRLDRDANHKLIHRNTAARKKSRLAKRLNASKRKTAG